MLIVCPATLLNSFTSFNSFLLVSLGKYEKNIFVLSAKRQFHFLLFDLNAFYFSSLIALARTSSTMLNRSGKGRHPCLVPDIGGKAFSIEYDVSCRLSFMAFIMLRYILCIPNLLRVFIMKGFLILSNAFSASIEMIIKIFIFYFVNVVYHND